MLDIVPQIYAILNTNFIFLKKKPIKKYLFKDAKYKP